MWGEVGWRKDKEAPPKSGRVTVKAMEHDAIELEKNGYRTDPKSVGQTLGLVEADLVRP